MAHANLLSLPNQVKHNEMKALSDPDSTVIFLSSFLSSHMWQPMVGYSETGWKKV